MDDDLGLNSNGWRLINQAASDLFWFCLGGAGEVTLHAGQFDDGDQHDECRCRDLVLCRRG